MDDVQSESYARHNSVVAVHRVPLGGISAVRNIGLRILHELKIADSDIVSFPDDDCRYPKGLARRVATVFKETNTDMLVGSYGEQPITDSIGVPLKVEDAAFRSSSVALFARWSLVKRAGGFNEALGVGSGVFAYGEDNDFALRAFRKSNRPIRNESIRIWHLEERPTTGRNPKGYLTSCWLNVAVPGVPFLIMRGIIASLVQDVRSPLRHGHQLKFMLSALQRSKIRRAKASRPQPWQ
ncbi:glycosyltransferase family 2 protein [Arthrobacter sp. AFG7.2]|uniref:glycosyltransferase family 2 protein n=1 Tax=Arthrobacter sp. AFG7.2 TaxID=1688693 RepID=UPI0011AF963A|nr:hypothetical protein [Arthrobacter sp. AFG7.2]